MTKAQNTAKLIRDQLILLGSDLRSYGREEAATAMISAVSRLPDEALYQMRGRILGLAAKIKEIDDS